MSNARYFSAIATTAVVTGSLVAVLTLSRPALAEAPPDVTCATMNVAFGGAMKVGFQAGADGLAAWMSGQLSAGKRNFFAAGPEAAPVVCAW